MPEQIIITEEHMIGKRLDATLSDLFAEYSRNQIQSFIKSGHIHVNSKSVKASYRLSNEDVIRVNLPVEETPVINPENIPLKILFEDADLAVVDKPSGMVVHPAAGHFSGTLVNAAIFHWPEMKSVGSIERAGIVHRLDKDTSGVIVLAKNSETLTNLQSQFKERTTEKFYSALVEGLPESKTGLIEAPIGRDPRNRKKMAVVRDGKHALTKYHVIEVFEDHSLLKVELYTGRTHQIRVHLAWHGHPVVGDTVYGRKKKTLPVKRFFLHAQKLCFDHPRTGERLTIEADLPSDLSRILSQLREKFI